MVRPKRSLLVKSSLESLARFHPEPGVGDLDVSLFMITTLETEESYAMGRIWKKVKAEKVIEKV